MSDQFVDGTVQGIYSEKLGRMVTIRSCDCSQLSRHTIVGPKTLECDYCGTTKFGVSERYVGPVTDSEDSP